MVPAHPAGAPQRAKAAARGRPKRRKPHSQPAGQPLCGSTESRPPEEKTAGVAAGPPSVGGLFEGLLKNGFEEAAGVRGFDLGHGLRGALRHNLPAAGAALRT
jgi:hypothetical protein